MVIFLKPSGVSTQAIMIISVSVLLLVFLQAFEFGLQLIAITDLILPSAYVFTIFETVALLISCDFVMICI